MRALCLNSEDVRGQVGRVEVRGGRFSGFRERLFFFGLLFVVGDRGKVRKLYGRFPKFHCCFEPRLKHIEIRHRVEKTYTINLFGFEVLKLKIRRLKLWKTNRSS